MTTNLKALLFCGALSASASALFAIPFASQIKVGSTSVAPGTGTMISYHLNEPADSVVIQLIDTNDIVGATFAGTPNRGANTVTWNGTLDNAAGAGVAAGVWKVRVTADKTSAGWSEITSNASAADLAPKGTVYNQLYSGFSPGDVVFVDDQESEFFGLGVVGVTGTSPQVAAAIQVNADMSTLDGTNGFDSRIFRSSMELAPTVNSFWGMCKDPDDPETIFFTGQHTGAGNELWRGTLSNPAMATTADPDGQITSLQPRAVVVRTVNGLKQAFFCNNNDIFKAPLDPTTNEVSGPSVKITTFQNIQRYARGIDFDAGGNLYFVSKHTSSGNGGVLYRWNASLLAANAQLTEHNSSWAVTFPTSMIYMMGPAITPGGDVFVAMISGTIKNKATGIFFIGNVSTPSIIRPLALEDCVVDFTAVGEPASRWEASTTYFNLRSDPVGNLVTLDRETQQVRVFGPPGEFSTIITAPASQAITVTAGVGNWGLY